MSKLQKRVFSVFFWLVVAINIWGALPSFYYAPYGSVGPDVVSVYEPDADLAPFVPIKKIDSSRFADPFVDTGKRVAVSIRNDYRDRRAEQLARVTLLVMLVGAILYRGVGRKKEPNQAPDQREQTEGRFGSVDSRSGHL